MSGAALKWARAQKLQSGVLKGLLNAIAARADQKGATWVAQATLGDDAGMGERTVRRHLAVLEALGVISRKVRSRGRLGRTTDEITLTLHRTFNISAADILAARKRIGATTKKAAAGSSNRPLCVVPTGQQWPGNRKGITYPSHQDRDVSGKGSVGVPNRSRLQLIVSNGNALLADDEEGF